MTAKAALNVVPTPRAGQGSLLTLSWSPQVRNQTEAKRSSAKPIAFNGLFWNVRLFPIKCTEKWLDGLCKSKRFGLAPHSGTFLLDAGAAKQRADKSYALA